MRSTRPNYSARRNRRIVAIGDLNVKINLQTRVLRSRFATGDDDESGFATFASPWAMVETFDGVQTFDTLGQGIKASHQFTIRYRSDITAQTYVDYKGQLYDISYVENLDERKEFINLLCKLTGPDDPNIQAATG
jgi:SPP1 family predicted phage head-tail adaptor